MAAIYSGDTMENPSSAVEKIFRWAIAAVCLAALSFLVWLAGITPFMPFSRIGVTQIEGFSREEILFQAGIGSASSFISTDTRVIEDRLRVLPQIEQVRVYKHFPDRLEIALEGRKAAAIALTQFGERTIPVYFDASGMIFLAGTDPEAAFPALPVISGLVIEDPTPGMRLPLIFTPLLSELDSLRIHCPDLLSAISEIRIIRKPQNGFDLIVYPVHRQIRVRLSELNEDLLRYTLLMVDVLASRDEGIGYIDFRSGMASYVPENDRRVFFE